jgi:hypothetical protein
MKLLKKDRKPIEETSEKMMASPEKNLKKLDASTK